MSSSNTRAEALTIKQRVFIGALVVFSFLLSALVLLCFSPARATSEALPCQHLSPTVYEGSYKKTQEQASFHFSSTVSDDRQQ